MMEVSILQHAKDTSPQAMPVSQVVDLIRGDQWPPGYQPLLLVQGTYEGGDKQKHIRRLSGLSMAVFKVSDPSPAPPRQGEEGSRMAELREEARADPHTLLLFTPVADTLVVIYPYELDTGYELYLQVQFYRKAFLFGNDYYEDVLGLESERRGKDAGKLCALARDGTAYYNPQAEPFLAWEIKEGCRRQSARPKSTDGLRDRKPSYHERLMSLEEIEAWIGRNIELRRNVITMRKEYRWKAGNPNPPPAGGAGGGCGGDPLRASGGEWLNFDDEAFNDVWRPLQKIKDTRRDHLQATLDSSFTDYYNPFTDYLESLPPWDGDDYIQGLAASVTVAGGFEGWRRFNHCLHKWLVAMVAGWVDPSAVNHEVLVFIGRQGINKTRWMSALLPPQLRSYFSTQSGVGDSPKDEELALTQFGLISCEELDVMNTREMNRMKRAVTLDFVNVRPPYGRHTVHRKHIASFCGTGNNEKFLNDSTGSRRWLTFKVEKIIPPGDLPFEYEGIYAQAYHLYRHGFQYWFDGDDEQAIDAGNSRFQVANLDLQLVNRHYRRPQEGEQGEFVSVADAMLKAYGSVASRVRKEGIDQAFVTLGFEAVKVDGIPGYLAVVRLPEEVLALGRKMAERIASGDNEIAKNTDNSNDCADDEDDAKSF